MGATVADCAAQARSAVDAGFTSIRTMPFLPDWEKQTPTRYIGDAAEIVRSIREEIGGDIDLGVEVHRNLSPDEAIILAREIEPLRILYYEDPVAPESLHALQYVASHVNIPIAAGERCHSLFQFKELLETRTVSMIRPDLSLAGGFTQCKKIAACAEAVSSIFSRISWAVPSIWPRSFSSAPPFPTTPSWKAVRLAWQRSSTSPSRSSMAMSRCRIVPASALNRESVLAKFPLPSTHHHEFDTRRRLHRTLTARNRRRLKGKVIVFDRRHTPSALRLRFGRCLEG